MKKLFLLTLAMMIFTTTAIAQKPFSYKEIESGLFNTKTVRGLRSMNNGNQYTTQKDNQIIKFNYKTGKQVEVIFDGDKLDAKFKFDSYVFSSDEKQIMLTTDIEPIYRHSYKAENYIYNIETKSLIKLSDKGKQQVVSFSPDGNKIAYVRDNNMFWYDITTKKTIQFTFDGKFNHILNGIPDWVYEEEYGFSYAYAWSPNSDAIAFYRTDEERVKEYHMNMFNNKLYPTVYSFKYPKAGEENSIVSINVYNIIDKKTTLMNTGENTDVYIPRIKWSNDNDQLIIFRMNRLQNELDLLMANATTGVSEVVYHEKEDQYIERITDETITFLPDGDRFIIKNEKDGFMHLYLYSLTKGEINQITSGSWEVTSMLGFDDKKDLVYYMSTEISPLRRNLYSIKLDGTNKKRITKEDGTYAINFSNGFKYFISYFSNVMTPNTVTLHTANGKQVRVLENNETLKNTIAEYGVPVKEFITIKTGEGIELNGYIVKPNNFDPNKKYPLFMTQYSGPNSQSVADRFSITWEDALVQEGIIVACIDGRGTGLRGEEFKKCTYLDLGKYEVIDQTEAAKYLGSLDYIDNSRIMIYGWSYGGFMALNCILKANDVFKAAIAIAPVTSWRYYDTIYTEVYNGLPQDNPKGYDDNSPINFADKLEGQLFISHGTGDDNVHIQNTYEMINALIKNDKDFEMYIVPDKNHSMLPNMKYRHHLMKKCIDFTKRNMNIK